MIPSHQCPVLQALFVSQPTTLFTRLPPWSSQGQTTSRLLERVSFPLPTTTTTTTTSVLPQLQAGFAPPAGFLREAYTAPGSSNAGAGDSGSESTASARSQPPSVSPAVEDAWGDVTQKLGLWRVSIQCLGIEQLLARRRHEHVTPPQVYKLWCV